MTLQYLLLIDVFGSASDRDVLVMSPFRCLSSIGVTDSLIITSGATQFIGTTARMGADDRAANDSLTRIFKLRTSGGACGFFIMPYDDFILDGESFGAAVDVLSNDRRFAGTASLDGADDLIGHVDLAAKVDFGEGGRIFDVVIGP